MPCRLQNPTSSYKPCTIVLQNSYRIQQTKSKPLVHQLIKSAKMKKVREEGRWMTGIREEMLRQRFGEVGFQRDSLLCLLSMKAELLQNSLNAATIF